MQRKLTRKREEAIVEYRPRNFNNHKHRTFVGKNISDDAMSLLKRFVAFSTLHPLNSELIETTILIRKNHNIKLPDAIIAATAIFHNLVLITRNLKDFQNIKHLKVINPHL